MADENGQRARIESSTTTWRLDPPVCCPRAYSMRGDIDVHLVSRQVYANGEEHWSVKGVPLTKTGKPAGGIDYRSITDDSMAELRKLVLDGHE